MGLPIGNQINELNGENNFYYSHRYFLPVWVPLVIKDDSSESPLVRFDQMNFHLGRNPHQK